MVSFLTICASKHDYFATSSASMGPAHHLLAQISLSLRHYCHLFGTCRSAGTMAMHLEGAILDKFRPHFARNSILFVSQLIRSDGTLKSWAVFCFAHNRRRCRPGIWFTRLQQVVLATPSNTFGRSSFRTWTALPFLYFAAYTVPELQSSHCACVSPRRVLQMQRRE
jgi:hypothetical protein